MTRTTNKITRSLAPALVMAALIAPTAGAYQDISSRDMRDVAEPSAPASGRHDPRSRDALDAARSLPPDQLAAVAEGLRSGAHGSDVGLMSGGVARSYLAPQRSCLRGHNEAPAVDDQQKRHLAGPSASGA